MHGLGRVVLVKLTLWLNIPYPTAKKSTEMCLSGNSLKYIDSQITTMHNDTRLKAFQDTCIELRQKEKRKKEASLTGPHRHRFHRNRENSL